MTDYNGDISLAFNAKNFRAEYFCNCLNTGYASFREKKNEIGRVVFALISINWHYYAMSKTLFWSPFWNGIFFFQIFFKKMESCSATLSQILLKFFWGKCFFFQILVKWLFSWNENSFFGRHFETKQNFYFCFAGIWL